jgi:hypothetical protein
MKTEMRVMKRIREKCLECCGGSPKEVRYCPLTDCPLWPVRFGHKPKVAIRRLGKSGKDLLNASNFSKEAKFGPEHSVS